jgi:hypothetical protein
LVKVDDLTVGAMMRDVLEMRRSAVRSCSSMRSPTGCACGAASAKSKAREPRLVQIGGESQLLTAGNSMTSHDPRWTETGILCYDASSTDADRAVQSSPTFQS